ncbi:MAG: DUF3307 domain-containing protein [Verrucomicrobiota bacterium]
MEPVHLFLATGYLSADSFTITSALVLFFAFLIGHALGDFPLQGDFIARFKNRHVPIPDDPYFDAPKNVWIYCLSAHALIHAGLVWAITANPIIGAIELVTHWLIDYCKGDGFTNFHVDQLLHVLCKIAYVGLIWAGVFKLGW